MSPLEPTSHDGEIHSIGEKYRVVRVLGTGGMGTVYECVNSWTGRRVAIKLLRPELSLVAPIVKRFINEAQASSRIEHPNIVDVLDMGRDPATGSFFIVQAYLEGEDLGTWMRRQGRLTPREALHLLVPVTDAIATAHEHGIVHRDIKPENVILAAAADGEIVPTVIDFGISKCVSIEAVDRTTQKGMAIGTPEYMSPEQARGDEELDPRTDIWSIGVMLYELLVGEVPFAAPTHNLIVLRVLTEEVPRIEMRRDDVSPALAEIVHKALARDRNERYATTRELLRALRKFAEREFAGTTPPVIRLRLGSGPKIPIPSMPPPITMPDGTLEPLVDLDRLDRQRTTQRIARRPVAAYALSLAAVCLGAAAFARAMTPATSVRVRGPVYAAVMHGVVPHVAAPRIEVRPTPVEPQPIVTPPAETPLPRGEATAPSLPPPPRTVLGARRVATTSRGDTRVDVIRQHHIDVE